MLSAGRATAAFELAAALAAIAAEVKVVMPEPGRPVGWSIAAEPAWDTAAAIAWAKQNATLYEPDIIDSIPAPQGAGAIEPGAAESVPTSSDDSPAQNPDGAGTAQEAPSEAVPLEAYEDERPQQTLPPRRKQASPGESGHFQKDPDMEPLPAALSDDSLANRLAVQHGEDWRFVRAWNRWFRWDGGGWRQDEVNAIARLCLDFTRKAAKWPEAAVLSPTAQRHINSRRNAGAVEQNLSHDTRIAARLDQWDVDPWLLGCPGGVLELQSGKMLEAHREQYITKRCAVAPEGGKPALWLEFLKTVTAGDQSLIDYLQRLSGYALTGDTSEHSLAFLYGTGANGKTVFLQVLAGIMGDYAVSAGFDTFAESKMERHSTEIARLRGARLVVTEETESGGRWAESRIKRLTGGGKITARFMRQDDFEFTPQFKLMIAGNHKPQLRAVDEAMRRRFHLVPFAVTIAPEDRDKHLAEKLRAEWPQILGWMLDGCVAWQECSLGLPEAIQVATDKYLEAEDTLGMWIDDCCEREGSFVSADGYRNYSAWCDKQGERAWSRRAWANALVDRGFDTGSNGLSRTIKGLSLKLRDAPAYPT